jgi:NhaP-type Na+/H+ or K+/H+ antiporter
VRALRGQLSVPLRLLGIGLPLTLLAGFVVALVVFPKLSWSEALLLAVIFAPTDAALGQAVVMTVSPAGATSMSSSAPSRRAAPRR